ncbi:MAG: hypothetical protein ABIQ04_04685 [Candidatus Saccharimonadales bacterium]
MLASTLFNQFAVILSLFTATGIALHDTKIDKAFVTTTNIPSISRVNVESAMTAVVRASEPHTHVERASVAQAIHEIQGGAPRIHPREDSRKHVTPKNVPRGHHAFDNYNLPLV